MGRFNSIRNGNARRFACLLAPFAEALESRFVIGMPGFYAHRHRQIAGTEESHIDALDAGNRFRVRDAFKILDLWNAQH